ncbi:MAG: AMP-binding enzyme, partial [Gammaproteobacteria bacterium]
YAHEAIEEVAVIGLPDDHWGESVAAVLRLCEGESVRSQTLENHVGASLARHKVPRRWFVMTEIPATASGKLQKYKLVDMFKEGTLQKFELPCRGA